MKVQIVMAALATLLLPVHGASSPLRLQCAGGIQKRADGDGSGIVYESSGFLTADFTQKSCAAAGGSMDPNKKGNEKCCEVSEASSNTFIGACESQKPGSNYQSFSPFPRGC